MNDSQTNKTDENKKKAAFRFPWKAFLTYIVPPVITIALCWILFTGIDVRQVWNIICTQCDFQWIALGLVISIISHIIRGLRWQMQLKALGINPPLFITILSIFGTYAVNIVLPRLGEFWRTGYIAERQKASFTEVFGSMICDRLADMLTVLILTVVTFFIANHQIVDYLSQDPERFSRISGILSSPWFWTAVVLAILAVWAIFRYFPNAKPVKMVRQLAKGIWDGFIIIVRMKGKALWILYSVLIWLAYFLELYVAFLAFPVTAQILHQYGIIAVLVCFVLSSIAMGVPSNGGIGPYQWALIFGLSMYAVPGLTLEYSSSFANLVLGANTIMLILLGIFTFIYITADKRKIAK